VKRGRPGGWRRLDESRVVFTLWDADHAEAAEWAEHTASDAM